MDNECGWMMDMDHGSALVLSCWQIVKQARARESTKGVSGPPKQISGTIKYDGWLIGWFDDSDTS
jgi:hypothetical protein